MDCKACTKCGEVKALDAFARYKSRRRAYCKPCGAGATAAWQKANTDRMKGYRAAWAKANPDKVKANNAAWAKANPDKRRAKEAAWRNANPDKRRAKEAAWRNANPDKVKAKGAAQTKALTPSYVASTIGVRVADLTPDLLTLKREQIEIHRLAKQVKQHLKEISK